MTCKNNFIKCINQISQQEMRFLQLLARVAKIVNVNVNLKAIMLARLSVEHKHV